MGHLGRALYPLALPNSHKTWSELEPLWLWGGAPWLRRTVGAFMAVGPDPPWVIYGEPSTPWLCNSSEMEARFRSQVTSCRTIVMLDRARESGRGDAVGMIAKKSLAALRRRLLLLVMHFATVVCPTSKFQRIAAITAP